MYAIQYSTCEIYENIMTSQSELKHMDNEQDISIYNWVSVHYIIFELFIYLIKSQVS